MTSWKSMDIYQNSDDVYERLETECDDVPLDLSIKKSSQRQSNEEESGLDYSDTFASDRTIRPELLQHEFSISNTFLAIECALSQKLRYINFSFPVEHIYDPVVYAYHTHAIYVTKYCHSKKKILFLGMNPGPWGMSQTGVPFGEVNVVRDWLKISGYIGKPFREQADRLVTGFNCTRSEISGRRFWSLFKELCSGDPENFFRYSFLHNYCPIALMDAGGRNITPAELKGPEQYALYAACDEALAAVLRLLQVEIVLGVGRFAEKRAQTVVKTAGLPVKVLCIPHPSPRSVGNENWSEKAKLKLREYDLMNYFCQDIEEAIYIMDLSRTNVWMDKALEEAEKSLKRGEVPVGCLFIFEDKVIATGSNTVNETRNATRHAELNCIDDVLSFCKEKNYNHKEVFKNIDVVVTVEPCIMCASALYQLQIRSIVYGCANDRFGGCQSVFDVSEVHKSKLNVIGGVKAEEAMQLLKDFYKGTNPNAPEAKKGRKKKVDNK